MVDAIDPEILLPPGSINLTSDRITQRTSGTAGVGGMGDVFQGIYARDGLSEIVAVKIFRENGQQSLADIARRLGREAGIWSRLHHNRIIHFHGVYQFPSTQCLALVSPWLDNGCAPDYLKKNKRTSDLSYILNLTKQIVDGVAYLHQNGVVHGDVKGDNVLIDSNFNAKISDFGRAFIINEIEVSKALCATAAWTAPEVMDHPDDEEIPLTTKSDMWSLGITILELFDGAKSLWGGPRKQFKLVLMITAEGKKPESVHYPQTTKIKGLWDCLKPCWNRDMKPIVRVTAEELAASLAPITV